MSIFGESGCRIQSIKQISGVYPIYEHSPYDYALEKKVKEESFELINSFGDTKIIKSGNRIDYIMKVFNITPDDITKLEQLDGQIIKFYPHYPSIGIGFAPEQYSYQECYFWYYYDDCNKSPRDMIVIEMTRKNLEILSNRINIIGFNPLAVRKVSIPVDIQVSIDYNSLLNVNIISEGVIQSVPIIGVKYYAGNFNISVPVIGCPAGQYQIQIQHTEELLINTITEIFTLEA